MTIADLQARLAPELVEWFADAGANDDGPELHLVGLGPGELERCFAAIAELGPCWAGRDYFIDDEEAIVTVAERPEVAALVAAGRVRYPSLSADGITIEGVVLPLVEMFLLPDEIEFFWWPETAWRPERVAGFFALMMRLLALAPAAKLRPDPRYAPEARRMLGGRIAELIGAPERLDYGR
jgi:hypothetical protein